MVHFVQCKRILYNKGHVTIFLVLRRDFLNVFMPFVLGVNIIPLLGIEQLMYLNITLCKNNQEHILLSKLGSGHLLHAHKKTVY